MAETPDLGAAQEAFTTTETGFKEVETSYNAAKTAWEADQENEDLKTAFADHEAKYNESKTAYQTAKDSLFEALKGNVRTGYWPEDWRDKYINDQKDKDGKPLDDTAKEKLLKRLSRYASPQAAFDAMINAQNKISSGLVKIPGKDATKEEIAEYRQALGVPEKPEDYDLSLGEGVVIGDEDKPMVNSFLTKAHEALYTPDQVKTGLQWYYDFIDNEKQKQYEFDTQNNIDTKVELKSEWGSEYKANINLMANYLSSDFSPEIANILIKARLPNGKLLGDDAEIIRGFAAKARKENPMGAMVPGSGTKQHEAMLDEISSIEKLMRTDREAYNKDKRMQDRYLKLIEARDKVK
jgi:hypothetical protein